MQAVSLFDAKTHLSRIVQDISTGVEDSFVVSRHGKPIAKIIPFCTVDIAKRIGVARGCFQVPDDIDVLNPEVENLFSSTEGA